MRLYPTAVGCFETANVWIASPNHGPDGICSVQVYNDGFSKEMKVGGKHIFSSTPKVVQQLWLLLQRAAVIKPNVYHCLLVNSWLLIAAGGCCCNLISDSGRVTDSFPAGFYTPENSPKAP